MFGPSAPREVLGAFDTGGYNSERPENVQYNERLMERAAHGYDNTCFRYYAGGGEGVGDKGNSGTVTTCRRLTKAINDPNAPIEIISATSDDLFKAYLGRKAELPSFDGELLMDVHEYPAGKTGNINQSLTAIAGVNYKIQVIAKDRAVNEYRASIEVACN